MTVSLEGFVGARGLGPGETGMLSLSTHAVHCPDVVPSLWRVLSLHCSVVWSTSFLKSWRNGSSWFDDMIVERGEAKARHGGSTPPGIDLSASNQGRLNPRWRGPEEWPELDTEDWRRLKRDSQCRFTWVFHVEGIRSLICVEDKPVD